MKKTGLIFLGCLLLFSCAEKKVQQTSNMLYLKVSDNHRYFMDEKGNPFFWLGDTGWLLFSKLNRDEAEKYLDNRAEKGFNVIQVMVLHSLNTVNIYGDSALVNRNVSYPNTTPGNFYGNNNEYDYWDHVDYVIDLAEKKGIYMALVPVWGSNVKNGGVSREQAAGYSAWLAGRFAAKRNIIWLNGGDTMGSDSTDTWNIIGDNIKKVAPQQLVTFHPFGRKESSMWFHNAPWLDFNMFQSGHRRYDQDDTELGYGQDNWRYVHDDYNRVPAKPTLDGEPSYEGIPQGLHDTTQPYWNANDLRRYAYWSVFAGACGFTYGNNAVMQMYKPEDTNPAYGAKEYWYEAIDAPGASQMHLLKDLMLSRPYFERVPDQSLIAGENGEKYDYLVATRGKDYAMIYTWNGRNMKINTGKIKGATITAKWYNPRNGEVTEIETLKNTGVLNFNPPGEKEDGNDWVLILDSVK